MIKKTDLLEFQREIEERCTGRLNRCSNDYWDQQYGFRASSYEDVQYAEEKITLPYDESPESLKLVRNGGRWLATQPTVIGITNKLISYVVGRGHTYQVKPLEEFKGRENKPNAARIRRGKQYTKDLRWQLKLMKWMDLQDDTYLRIVRDGEVFRRIWDQSNSDPLRPNWRITVMEPETIVNPSDVNSILDFNELPGVVQELTRDGYFGVHGIMSDPDDVTNIFGYWRKKIRETAFEFVDSQSVQHIKAGVDMNDPRGVPLFYWGIPHAVQIQEVNGSMVDLCLVQAKHAVVYQWMDGTLQDDIEDIANNRIDDRMSNNDRPLGPGEVDAKGAQIQVTGMTKAAKNDIEIIQQQQRFLGNLVDAPEFMATSDANTGSRSNLISAEGPFDRRTQRTQVRLFSYDEELFTRILTTDATFSPTEFQVVPEFPVAATRDKAKEAETEVLLVDSEVQSVQQARDHLKIDNERAEIEISQQDRPSLKQQFDAKIESQSFRSGNPGSGTGARQTQGRQGARSDP